MNIFLSYNWNNKNEADLIENNLSSLGINIKRDINDIKYKDELRDFMLQIRRSDYAVILLSSDYLKSPNCLFELMQLFKDKDYNKKMLPIIVDGTNIYSVADKATILKYWADKCGETENILKGIEPTNAINLLQELKLYKNILTSIDDFIDNISKRLNITFSDAIKNNFSDLLSFIGFDANSIQKEILIIRNTGNSQIEDLELEKLHKKHPKNKDIVFAIGYINLTELKNYHKSKEYFLDYVINLYPESYIGYNNLGLSCFNLEELELAEQYYYKGIEIDPNGYQLYHNLGNLEARKKNYSKAKDFFLKSISLYPKDAETFYNVAKIYADFESNLTLGKEYYLKAIELEPDFFMAYNNLASIFLREKKFDDAIKTLETGLSKNPNDYVTLYNLGALINNYQGDFNKAKRYFRDSIRLNNKYISAKLGLAKLLILNFGDFEEATEVLLDAFQIEPDNEDILIHLSIVYEMSGNESKAKEFSERALKLNPNLKKKNYG